MGALDEKRVRGAFCQVADKSQASRMPELGYRLSIGFLGVSDNSFILLGVLVLFVFALAYGLLRAKGSGITHHSAGGRKDEAGTTGPSEETAKDQGQSSATGADTYGASDPQHGAK